MLLIILTFSSAEIWYPVPKLIDNANTKIVVIFRILVIFKTLENQVMLNLNCIQLVKYLINAEYYTN